MKYSIIKTVRDFNVRMAVWIDVFDDGLPICVVFVNSCVDSIAAEYWKKL